uniref:Uncharacterized protein n=1 Tax=Arundo donax TaxID=35708 RepID=A0A0A9G9S5_ARUDO
MPSSPSIPAQIWTSAFCSSSSSISAFCGDSGNPLRSLVSYLKSKCSSC